MPAAAPDFTIRRFEQSDYATWGELLRRDGTRLALTLEPSFRDADHDGVRDRLGRIQHGDYTMVLRASHLHGGTGKRDYDVWEFEGVPDAIAAQVHIGNFPWHTEGCVLLGTQRKMLLYTGDTVRDSPYPRTQGGRYLGLVKSHTAHTKWMHEAAAAQDEQGRIRVAVVDDFAAPHGTWA